MELGWTEQNEKVTLKNVTKAEVALLVFKKIQTTSSFKGAEESRSCGDLSHALIII